LRIVTALVNQWMQHGFKPGLFVGVVKHDLAQATAIDRAIGVLNFGAEMAADLFKGQLTRFQQLATDDIGVDDRNAKSRK
jgi:hypothetical protein